VDHVDDNVGRIRLGKGVAVNTNACGSSKFSLDVVVVENHPVVSRLGILVVVAISRTVALFGISGCTGVKLQLAHRRHYQNIA